MSNYWLDSHAHTVVISEMTVVGDHSNKNRNIFPPLLRGMIVKDFHDALRVNSENYKGWVNYHIVGQTGLPPDGCGVFYDKISHYVKDLRLEGGIITAKIKTFNYPEGKRLEQLIEKNAVIFRMVGEGSIAIENGSFVVQNDFVLKNIHAIPTGEVNE